MISKNKLMNFLKYKITKSIIYKYLILRKRLLTHNSFAISIELTNKCNLKCRMCPRPKMKNLEVGDIKLDLFRKLIDDASRWADEKTSFTPVGLGDPLMYPHLSDALGYIKSKCPMSPIIINTNGVLLSEDYAEKLIDVTDKYDDIIVVSLNVQNSQNYRWLMGANRYDQVVNNIKNFINLREKKGQIGPKVIVQILETKITKPGIKEFKNYWAQFLSPKDSVYVKPLLNWGGRADLSDLEVGDKGTRYPCLSLWVGISIDKDGNMYPCCEGFSSRNESDLILGNVKDNSLMDLYLKRIVEIRKRHLMGRWDRIRDCSSCNFWSYYPNIWLRINKKFY